MAMSRSRRRDRAVDYWPGFVDALSTLLLVIIFLLSMFVVAQFVLTREVSGRDEALARLNAQIAELTELLALERAGSRALQDEYAALSASLSAALTERNNLADILSGARDETATTDGRVMALEQQLQSERRLSAEVSAQVELLNQQIAALRRQLAAIEAALEASETRNRDSQARIADLGSRLNVALAQRVQELSRYRSEFFGRLREVLAGRADIRVVGDRFVFQSEIFFDTGAAELNPQGLNELDTLVAALRELETQIPSEIPWVLRVDGHTDARPIRSPLFPSNWELSAARAIAVVKYMVDRGISPQRLVAAGFGEFQPIEEGDTEEVYRRNRRIELKLTER